MKTKKSNVLAYALRDFFANYLPLLRGLSPHTILSYRDCWILLLRFASEQQKRSIVKLDVEDLNVEIIIAFLQMLEDERSNSATTRNVRLAAIHAFFHYLAGKFPEKLEHCQRVLAVPFKRARYRPVEYLEYDEIQEILSAIDQTSEDGRRDYTLLVTMFNTGARVQEILDIRIKDIQLIKPYQVHLFGKGRKERLCPLWKETATLLQNLLATRINAHPNENVFLNHRRQPLTRFGVRYLLAKYHNIAKKHLPTLINKKLHPHILRHSTAVHLLQSGVDIVTICHWLGHANINTTNRYISIDLEMKRKAIDKVVHMEMNSTSTRPWNSDQSILDWLESL
jgi:integrase/recombinase XerD